MDNPLGAHNSFSYVSQLAAGQVVHGVSTPAHLPADVQSPHIVIRGESNYIDTNTTQPIALVDWLSFTLYSASSHTSLTYLKKYLENLFGISPAEWTPTKSGYHRYKHKIKIGSHGIIAYGGEAQKDTVHVSINGSGCKTAKDWSLIRLIGEEKSWSVKRVDLAHDDFSAKHIDIDRAIS